jgi:hypothetical protein
MVATPVNVLVLRAWLENGDELRVRVLELRDRHAPARSLGVVATVDEACELVRSWLASLRGRA